MIGTWVGGGHRWIESGEVSNGKPILYRYANDHGVADCPHCRADTCMQKVWFCEDWEPYYHVSHINVAELS